VTNSFVASSSPTMRELRLLKKVLDDLGLQVIVKVKTIRGEQIRSRAVTPPFI
jgi:hypothetical protein